MREQEIHSGLTVAAAIDLVTNRLATADLVFGHGALSAADEAFWLVYAVCELPFEVPVNAPNLRLSGEQAARISALVRRRCDTREPLAYLLGEAWFAGLPFAVDESVLIPRSPLAELTKAGFGPWLPDSLLNRALEIGTGSGCIAVALAHQCPDLRVTATDISKDALAIAARNCRRHGVEQRVTLREADVFTGIADSTFDLIISNPPYVSDATMRKLPAEYRHEPALALVAGADGLSVVTRILRDAPDYLADHGLLVVEVGESQARLMAAYPEAPLTWLEFSDGDSGVFLLTRTELTAWLNSPEGRQLRGQHGR